MKRRTRSNADAERLAAAEGVLCDLDGTLYVGNELLPGAAEAIELLRERSLRLRFLTNTTTRSRDSLHRHLHTLGLAVEPFEILSAAYAGVLYLRSVGSPRCRLILQNDAAADYHEFRIDETEPQVIVLGDIGRRWDYDLLDSIFHQTARGARLLALHRNRYFQTADGLSLDVGAFVAALEYAARTEATVIGKPAKEFFRLALAELELPPENVIIIGDDIENDVGAGQNSGLTGILVKTGKYRKKLAAASGINPMFTLESVGRLGLLLGNSPS